jgi:hypothetical protein
MKLDCVLTATNEKDMYIDFIPIFIDTWKKLYPEVDVKIVLIAESIPEKFLHYSNNIILFKPIENVLTGFTAQFIRLLYPCILNYNNGVIITDIDMLPMNSSYYSKNIISYDSDKFIYYRGSVCLEHQQIAMCYNVATPKTWSEIFEINSLTDIITTIKHIYSNNIIIDGHNNSGWCIDQITLYDKVKKWNEKTKNFIQLDESITGFNRLSRNTFNINDYNIRKNIEEGKYTDYHCFYPMSNYSQVNYEIYNLLQYNTP